MRRVALLLGLLMLSEHLASASECYFFNAYPSTRSLRVHLSAEGDSGVPHKLGLNGRSISLNLQYGEHKILPCASDSDRVLFQILSADGHLLQNLTVSAKLNGDARSMFVIAPRPGSNRTECASKEWTDQVTGHECASVVTSTIHEQLTTLQPELARIKLLNVGYEGIVGFQRCSTRDPDSCELLRGPTSSFLPSLNDFALSTGKFDYAGNHPGCCMSCNPQRCAFDFAVSEHAAVDSETAGQCWEPTTLQAIAFTDPSRFNSTQFTPISAPVELKCDNSWKSRLHVVALIGDPGLGYPFAVKIVSSSASSTWNPLEQLKQAFDSVTPSSSQLKQAFDSVTSSSPEQQPDQAAEQPSEPEKPPSSAHDESSAQKQAAAETQTQQTEPVETAVDSTDGAESAWLQQTIEAVHRTQFWLLYSGFSALESVQQASAMLSEAVTSQAKEAPDAAAQIQAAEDALARIGDPEAPESQAGVGVLQSGLEAVQAVYSSTLGSASLMLAAVPARATSLYTSAGESAAHMYNSSAASAALLVGDTQASTTKLFAGAQSSVQGWYYSTSLASLPAAVEAMLPGFSEFESAGSMVAEAWSSVSDFGLSLSEVPVTWLAVGMCGVGLMAAVLYAAAAVTSSPPPGATDKHSEKHTDTADSEQQLSAAQKRNKRKKERQATKKQEQLAQAAKQEPLTALAEGRVHTEESEDVQAEVTHSKKDRQAAKKQMIAALAQGMLEEGSEDEDPVLTYSSKEMEAEPTQTVQASSAPEERATQADVVQIRTPAVVGSNKGPKPAGLVSAQSPKSPLKQSEMLLAPLRAHLVLRGNTEMTQEARSEVLAELAAHLQVTTTQLKWVDSKA